MKRIAIVFILALSACSPTGDINQVFRHVVETAVVQSTALAEATAAARDASFATSAASALPQALPPEQPTSNPTMAASPIRGPTIGGRGDNVLKADVWNSIVGAYASTQNCTDVTSTGIEVTQEPDSNGVWQENWTVLACGQTEILKVKFTPSPQGGTDYHITQ